MVYQNLNSSGVMLNDKNSPMLPLGVDKCLPQWGWGDVCVCVCVGGGTPIFFFMRRRGPSIYCLPPKNVRNFMHPKNNFKF